MSKNKKEKKFTLQAAALSAIGIAGTVLWQKKDFLKAIVQLRQYPQGWVLIQKEPEVFLTKISEASKENLFAYLDKSPWRLVDQVADGYFWMNQQEEILLLTQKKILGDYWSWTASRSFFASAVPKGDVEAAEPLEQDMHTDIEEINFDYDLTEESRQDETLMAQLEPEQETVPQHETIYEPVQQQEDQGTLQKLELKTEGQ